MEHPGVVRDGSIREDLNLVVVPAATTYFSPESLRLLVVRV
jgi:hypothetical protein